MVQKMSKINLAAMDIRHSLCVDFLRLALSLLLVFFHTFQIQICSDEGAIQIGVKRIIDAFLSDLIVPVFFLISGYFFFKNRGGQEKFLIGKLKRRLRTLLLPYCIWNTLGILLVVIKDPLKLFSGGILSSFWMYNGWAEGENGQTTYFPINTALWYVRDLMMVVLCSPLLYLGLKKIGYGVILTLTGLFTFFSLHYVDWHLNQLSTAFLFFSLGAWLSLHGKTVPECFEKHFSVSLILYPVFSIVYLFLSEHTLLNQIIKVVNSFAVIPFSFCVAGGLWRSFSERLTERRRACIAHMGALSTYIYMSHCLVFPRVLKLLCIVINPKTDFESLACYLGTFALSLSLVIISYIILRKRIPVFLKFLIGRM